jgi:2-oxoglutarate dehydrogenase E2 component (dihydrolipoamide succinyltransferase)
MMRRFSSPFFSFVSGSSSLRFFAVKKVEVPKMGDSISEGIVQNWNVKENDFVELDQVVAVIETDKVKVDIRAPEAGQIVKLFAAEGDTVEVGKVFFELDTDKNASSEKKAPAKQESESKEQPKEAQKKEPKEEPKEASKEQPKEAPKQESKPKEEPRTTPAEQKKPAPAQAPPQKPQQSSLVQTGARERKENRVPMSRLRQRVAQRLKESQNTYAFLTTFNEIDMSQVMQTRADFGEEFQKANGVKLGFMSFFIKAVTIALRERPIVNAVIDGKEVVHRNYVDVSVAVQGPDGLVVPVIRDADRMSFADIEKAIIELGNKAKNGQLAIEDMVGGTITVSNGNLLWKEYHNKREMGLSESGGIFGSIMSTPLINPPQSAILGMHNVVQRPVVRDGQIVARPVM